jgi:glucose-1-phosphate thymidylyltransferase
MRRDQGGASLNREQADAARAGAKAMMPVAGSGRPFLDYALSAIADAGWTDVCLVIAPDHDHVRDYYARAAPPRRLSVSFAVQSEPRGTADALLAAESWAGADHFLVVNGDNYYPVSALRPLRTFPGPGTTLFVRDLLVARSNIPANRVQAFALCRVSGDGMLAEIVEKPAALEGKDDLISMNCWVMPPDVFQACRQIAPSVRGELEIADAVTWLIRTRGVAFRVNVSEEGVLDLSERGDVAAVSRALAEATADP